MTIYADETMQTADRAADVLDRARLVQPLLDAYGEGHDERGRLDPVVVDALHDGGLFGLWTPTSLGGSELDPVSSIEVVEALAYGDPSSAWVAMAASMTTGCAGAYLGDEAVAQMFAGDRLPVTAGQGSRPGTAVPVDGGYRLTGAWNFGSGIKHADYVHSLAVIEGQNQARIFLVPVAQAETSPGSWDVMGLRGTGSLDYRFTDVFVPAEFSYASTSVSSTRGGALYGLGTLQSALIGHGGWALGVGRRLLDELVQARAARPLPPADVAVFHTELAVAEASLRAARAFVLDAWADLWATMVDGEQPTRRQRTAIRLATHHATWTASQVSDIAYRAAGTTALRSGAIQRFYRDAHAGTQHITSGPGILRECGKELAGAAGDDQWFNLALVTP